MIFNRTYKEISNEIEALDVKFRNKAIYMTFSIVISFLAILAPLAIIINLFIFIDYKPLLLSMIAGLLILLVFLINKIYLKLLTKGKIFDISVVYIQDTFIMGFLILIILFIILELGVF